MPKIRRLLIANCGEIAIRVMRAASELGIGTVAIYSQEDRFALRRTKSDQAYLVGIGKHPIDAYLDIPDILRIAREAQVDAIHPGYGFLSENPQFAEQCAAAGVIFIGPSAHTMRLLGNKVAARNLAASAGVPVMGFMYMACRAANTPTCASRLARSVWMTIAGLRLCEPTRLSTRCLVTSSR